MSDILPNDVVIDILSRLPVKSLLRFQLVSKPWLSLISSPDFATLQYDASKNRPQKILILNHSLPQSLDSSATTFDYQNASTPLDFPFKKPYDTNVHVIGSCHGLVCVAFGNYEDIVIWNPSTGAHRKLPNLDISSGDTRYQCGFGYDSSTNDYKVFLATRSIDHSFNETQINVFATKAESWKRIQLNTTSNGIQCCETLYWHQRLTGCLVNGCLHWSTKWQCGHGKFTVITAFDLAEEKFSEVAMPDDVDELNGSVFIFLTLGVIDGHLCLVTEGRGGSVEFWMMKEHRVKSSWEKIYDIGNCNELCCDPVGMKPLCCTRLGEIIMTKNGNELLRYNPDNETKLEHLMITSDVEAMQIFERMKAIAYVESLITPPVSINM